MSFNRSSASEYNREFWSKVEAEIGDEIPEIIKTMLSKCGYEHRFCLATMTTSDVDEIEKHIRILPKDKVKRWLKIDSEYEHTTPHEFVFLPGHRKLITLISKEISTVDEETTTDDNEPTADGPKSDSSNPCAVVVTIPNKKLTALQDELCQSIRQWMSRKNYGDIVSVTAMCC